MKTIKGADLVATVRKLADEKPDYVYGDGGTCRYFDPVVGDSYVPGCIVGHALAASGVTYDELGALHNVESVTDLTSADHPKIKFEDLDAEQLGWLDEVQTKQDEQVPWGRAVAYADGLVEDDEDETL